MQIQKVSHFFSQLSHAKIQNMSSAHLLSQNIQLDIKRDDLLHPIISGNKWRKLKHLLIEIEAQGYKKIAVMGGQYSNLLHSVSYIAMLLGWQAYLYVGAHPEQELTPMLNDAIRWGAKVNYVNRIQYRNMRDEAPLLEDDIFWIPEGGYAELALKGSIESLMEIPHNYDYLIIASATGTSLAGYCQGASQLSLKTKMIGICVLNNDDEIVQHVRLLTDGKVKPVIIKDYTFGGYAKKNDQLIQFIKQAEAQFQIPLEPVYSGKSFYAVMDLIKKGYFPTDSKILLIHCGGLQGRRE